jgi:hypothetical protein
MSGSALFNLSLLTSDMWAVAVRALVFRQPVRALSHLMSHKIIGDTVSGRFRSVVSGRPEVGCGPPSDLISDQDLISER